MVSIEKKDGNFIFEVRGLHKLWALRSQLQVPAGHIKTAYVSSDGVDLAGSLRMPGTHIPGLITAGTYLAKDGTIFCDITNNENSLVVELQDDHFTRLVIEVEDPQAAIDLLTKN